MSEEITHCSGQIMVKEGLKGILRKIGKVYSLSEVSQKKKNLFPLNPLNFTVIVLNCSRYANNMMSIFFERKD